MAIKCIRTWQDDNSSQPKRKTYDFLNIYNIYICVYDVDFHTNTPSELYFINPV